MGLLVRSFYIVLNLHGCPIKDNLLSLGKHIRGRRVVGKSAEMTDEYQVAQEILDSDLWARGLSDKLEKVKKGSQHLSIYRVPSNLRKVKNDAYKPRVVSIGPLHRNNNPNLLAMKEHKWRYMLLIFQQTDNIINTIQCLQKCTNAFYASGKYPLNKKVRESYAVDLKNIKEHDLAEMMLVDGCFILQLFLENHQSCDQANDPIFSSAWMLPTLRHDLTLLENQIPFFILEELYGIIRPHIVKYTPPDSVATLALKFFQPMYQQEITRDTDTAGCKNLLLHLCNNFFPPSLSHIIELGGPAKPSNQQTINEGTDTEDCQHLLHLLHNFFRPSLSQAASKKKKNKFKYCASDLYDIGVQFEIGSADGQLLSIDFDDGVIKIPPLFIDDTTDSLFRNLIAFEQCHLKSSHHITSYVIVMKSLIRSKEDIKLLKEKGIIHENFAGGKYYVDFESILDHINLKHFCFGKLCDDVNEYSKSSKFHHWHKFKAFWTVRLQRDMKSLYDKYFSSPWSLMAFLAAAVVFSLTVTQTHYAIHPR
ncbi:hypothetical protein L3X38_034914 [Prunus dulcis]|uniref:Uncharacterized protein n=1 Tax=Prunus dulcis TaxID=3755 RepID=A0AAD4YYC1_PRUDU|nr:hypothetical protein L3X38_034914 [Prunus dulcis]